jgi:hypothetical protein
MTTLLEKALEMVGALPQDERDAIASQILESLAEEEAWKQRFGAKREQLREPLPRRFARTLAAKRALWICRS